MEADRRGYEPRRLGRNSVSLRHQWELIARLEGARAHPFGSTQLSEIGRERTLCDRDIATSQELEEHRLVCHFVSPEQVGDDTETLALRLLTHTL